MIESVVRPKEENFGKALRGAIKANFTTSKAFALRAEISEGRVSQLLSGEESIAARTLADVLAMFENPATRVILHDAWVKTFTPARIEIGADDIDETVTSLLSAFSDLVAVGESRLLISLLLERERLVRDPTLRLKALKAAIDLALFLERPALALRLSQALSRLARQSENHVWLAVGEWTAATASRNASSLPLSDVVARHERFRAAVMSLDSAPKNDQELFRELMIAVVRDRILTMLRASERSKVSALDLQDAHAPLERMLHRAELPKDRAVILVVKGRLLAAQDQLFAAEEVLDEVREIQGPVSHDHRIKLAIAEAELQLKRQKDEGYRALEALEEECLQVDALHHVAVIERLLVRRPQ